MSDTGWVSDALSQIDAGYVAVATGRDEFGRFLDCLAHVWRDQMARDIYHRHLEQYRSSFDGVVDGLRAVICEAGPAVDQLCEVVRLFPEIRRLEVESVIARDQCDAAVTTADLNVAASAQAAREADRLTADCFLVLANL